MKLEDVRSAYEDLSAKASDLVRQISLAGVGLIWAFKSTAAQSIALDSRLLKAAFFIALSLSLDFLQYVLGATIWFIYFRYKEKHGTNRGDEFKAPHQINWPTWGLFYFKCAAMLIAYGCYIIPFLAQKLGH